LCAECEDGYFLSYGKICKKCMEDWYYYVVLSIVGVIIIGLVSFIVIMNVRNSMKEKSEKAMLIKMLVNFMQTTVLISYF